ncbi:MAG: type II toxin-antitoxin system PemK/MazF family toxin [Aliifodinibius sp.]|nr:type II toxin-antitoxin system PemK/MazF family toxin [Fodinibius sp.]NIV14753.1 type II toxin-antitoxin system PemK/MazF family toxin [Fodinibius sp.]NIY25479.1 type II toxin-antitoxin system PemK/MazF family toxin [Fodinibius sp.]
MKGKIVLVPFPFDDLSSAKMRPAVCLTNAAGPHRHVVLAFITSRIPDEKLDSDIVINSSDKGFHQTGLRVSSTIRLHRLMTVTTSLIKRELGKLPSQTAKGLGHEFEKFI